MADQTRVEGAARHIFESQEALERLAPLPADIAPHDMDEAYAAQDALIAMREEAGQGALAGWKVALTSKVMQEMVGIGHPSEGPIRAPQVLELRGEVDSADFLDLAVETEIAVRLAKDLPAKDAPYDRDSVAGAVGACMAATEIVDLRKVDYKAMTIELLITDGSMNRGCVLGPPVEDWRGLDLGALPGRMKINGETVGEGHGRDALGHPFEPLAWLANNLVKRGRMLRKGDIVMTGSIVTSKPLKAGDEMISEVDGLGVATLIVR
ncbi:MAG: hydratase [Rhodospirillaceae bacterium]|jgi:2-keto-4-pentenoate hydratase|nr:hydratase [Rhodospirillaceae bacterium]